MIELFLAVALKSAPLWAPALVFAVGFALWEVKPWR